MEERASDSLVSIIVPVYNAGIRLVDALVSAQEQTHQNIEVICVNDGSTDESLDIMRIFANEDERFRVHDKGNGGYGAAMNDGLEAARGEWIAILEPDDWMDANMLEEMLAFADSLSEMPDVVKCPYWWVKEEDEFGDARLNCTYKGLVHPRHQPFSLEEAPELIGHHPSIWSAIYRKRYLDRANIRFPEYPGSGWADNRFMMEALGKTDRIAYLDQPFYNYRAGVESADVDFVRANPALPFERWMDISRVMESEGMHDMELQRAQVRRGFTYLSMAAKAGVLDDPRAVAAIQAMFNEMPESIVLADPATLPELRVMYAQMMGIECMPPNRISHATHLIKEGLHRIRINGLSATLDDIKRYLG